ncbi:MAG: capsule assembly Wzi family protein [Melioribacteraceae bacterium]|nr:capsule assembly Wzi family protein [Melioribacteraceae bacterium]MCF8264840.1 capsule assembly Wzi family protein [Melioribacteraceae bacterium]MCF8431757.1 capsule assembly Wzi family protein [Melioribacteraceae bacterium]
MKKQFLHHLLILPILLLSSMLHAQSSLTSVNDPVYEFLNRQAIKGRIQFDSEVLPKSRSVVVDKLKELEEFQLEMNEIESDELDWFIEKFEIDEGFTLSGFGYKDSSFSLSATPIVGYGISNWGGKSGTNRSFGIKVNATYGQNWGIDINMTDNGEIGDNVDREKLFSPRTGYDEIGAPNGIEFSDVQAGITYTSDWGEISFRKGYNKWGNGKFGKLILGTNSASFPQINLKINPVPWLRFYYMHGWLNSQVIDYNYYDSTKSIFESSLHRFIPKYIAINMLTVSPWDWMNISMGNSSVYSGDVRAEMLIPFMFFKYLDRDVGKGSIEDGNGSLFFEYYLKYPKNFGFYYTFYLEVTELRRVFQSDLRNTWFGYTIGGTAVDLFVHNLDLFVEYTKINPWVYEHKDVTTTYKHLGYDLGHWIGQNADQFRIQINYQPVHRVKIQSYFENYRKGDLDDISLAYGLDEIPAKEFLYGNVRTETTLGLEVQYEYLKDTYAKLALKNINVTDEDPDRTLEFKRGNNISFSFGLYYGFD